MVLARVRLGSTREVSLAALHVTPSYGRPVDEGWLRRRAQHLYGDAPVHLMPPDRSAPPNPIPAVICMGLLQSEPLNPDVSDSTHSHLVLIWWQDDVPVRLPPDLPWDGVARDEPIW